MMYTVKPEFYEQWGSNYDGELISRSEVEELAKAWDKPIEELMDQLEEFGAEEPSRTKMYHIGYFNDEGGSESIILFVKNTEEVGDLFANICDTLEGGASGGLNYIDEIATLTKEEAQTVEDYNSANWADRKTFAEAYVAIFEKYGMDSCITEEMTWALQPDADDDRRRAI